MKKQEDTYEQIGTFTYPNAVIRVFRPVLSEEERERRMDDIKKATEKFMRAVLAEEQKNGTKENKVC